ncbi:hypothetical protein ACVYFC_18000 [Vibrio cholerae]
MKNEDKFWDVGPHEYLAVEDTFHEFIREIGETIVADELSGDPNFNNADYLLRSRSVVAELKEVETEFLKTSGAIKKQQELIKKLLESNPNWKPHLLGGAENYPDWFIVEYLRIARPPIARILKKANKQIKDTKNHFNLPDAPGVLFFVNDGFTSIAPDLAAGIACDALVNSYSSIDCFVYLTLNRYIVLDGSNEPKLLWNPSYSSRSDDSLVDYIDDLGRKWFKFLDKKINFTSERIEIQDRNVLRNSKHLILPSEK